MKKYFITLAICFFSFFSQALDIKEGEYVLSSRAKNFVKKDPLNALSYQLLRHSQALFEDDRDNPKKKKFHIKALSVWSELKQSQISETAKQKVVKVLLDGFSMYLTFNHRERALTLGLIEKTIWDSSTLKFGPTVTSLLKGVVIVAIVSTFIVCPAAAAVAGGLQGSFGNSCTITQEQKFTSSDRNIQGNFVRLEASCRYDREDHGLKTNIIVVPESGPCGYLHNNNGTLIASDSYYSLPQGASAVESHICPALEGSFKLTCGKVIPESYKSSDSRIPVGSVCEYKVIDCQKRGGGWHQR